MRFITFRGVEETYQAWDGVPREVIDTNRTYNGFTYDNQVDHYDPVSYTHLDVYKRQIEVGHMVVRSRKTLDFTCGQDRPGLLCG